MGKNARQTKRNNSRPGRLWHGNTSGLQPAAGTHPRAPVVLLMLLLREEEAREGRNVSHDARTRRAQLVNCNKPPANISCTACRRQLLWRCAENGRPVFGANIIRSLAIGCRRVMRFKEDGTQLCKGYFFWVENRANHFHVVGTAGVHLSIRGVRSDTIGISALC